MINAPSLPASAYDNTASKLRKDVRDRTRAMFEEGDLAWSYRRIRVSADYVGLAPELRDLVWDSLWTTEFNGWNSSSSMEVQAWASKYLSDSRFHCTRLRNFFLYLLLEHLRKQAAVSMASVKWAGVWAALFASGVLLCVRSSGVFTSIGGLLAGIGILGMGYSIEVVSKLAKTVRTQPLLSQVIDEVSRGAFDERVTEERVRTLEGRGTKVPSVVYTLLRQPAINVERAFAAEWAAVPNWQRDEINEELIRWWAEKSNLT